ncbi:low molecular weight phosphotyrosine protein phosphatase [Oligoflexaceae bacterium]|nr:low molecular weight phosphotyrosine protein phosphatase [Oligoflexaceae bacterium]
MTSTDTESPVGVLFVCLGNICRSPAAEAIFHAQTYEKGLLNHFEIDSCGTSGYRDGEDADSRMKSHGLKRGFSLTSASRKLEADDFSNFDYIVAMDKSNLENIKKVEPRQYSAEIVEMCTFLKGRTEKEVPDPYFGGESGFELVYDILENACSGLLNKLTEKHSL